MAVKITTGNLSKGMEVEWANGLNCYSFAAKCDNPGGGGLISCLPGARGGRAVTQGTITPISLHNACVADGFIDVSGGVISSNNKFKNPPVCEPTNYLIAVFYDTRRSFHFARQLADGSKNKKKWVHKPSAAQDAHNMQNGWYLLDDLSNAEWGNFEFVSYLKAPNAGLTVNKGTF